MASSWVYVVLAMVLLGVSAIVFRGLRAPSWMQRRLFLLFALLSTLPALAVLALHVRLSGRQLELMDSPGLEASLDSSLELARISLDGERQSLQAVADSMATRLSAGDDLQLPLAWGYLLRGNDGGVLMQTGWAKTWQPPVPASGFGAPQRRELGGSPYLLARAAARVEGESAELWVLKPLDPQATVHLDAVRDGASRFRQLRLYYGKLLRGDALLTLSILTLALLVTSLLLARRLARSIGDPVARLARGTRRVAAGDLDHRVEVTAHGELGELVTAFNSMTSQLRESEERLVRSERIAAWQGMARRLAHEIKNPLTPIRLSLHRIRQRVDEPAVSECLDVVLEETENLRRLADEFAAYARLPAPILAPLRPREVMASVVKLHAQRTRMEIRWEEWSDDGEIQADEGLLRQAFANLVKNAVEATEGRGVLELSARRGAETLSIRVADSGPGLPGGNGMVFRPQFTTKATGTGLGLPITRRIIEEHGGKIWGENGPDGGAVFCLELPVTSNSPRCAENEA